MASSNQELIEHLEDAGVLRSARIKEALLKFPREKFVPRELQSAAYEDRPLPIGEGQTISQPYTVVFMLELLDARKGDRVLEIGAGSGWQTALLSHLVSTTDANVRATPHPRIKSGASSSPLPQGEGTMGHVWAYEINHAVAEFGKGNLARMRRDAPTGPSLRNVNYIEGDAVAHAPEHAPYGRIIAGAAFGNKNETQGIASLLVFGGRMVVPTQAGDIRLIVRTDEGPTSSAGKFEEEIFPGFSFVPIVH